MAVEHYENFPVASLLLPARLRPAVEAIYHFARSADDIADEGEATPDQRLAALRAYEQELDALADGRPGSTPIFTNLQRAIDVHHLPLAPLRALLSAFKQDVTTLRCTDFSALLDYCRRSANPVGELMLHLYDAHNAQNLAQSDAICSALQLVNFCQDVDIDWRKGRIYFPLEDLARFGVREAQFAQRRVDQAWCDLMRFEVARARTMLLAGAPLALRLPGRIGWELRLVVQGGLRILERIDAAEHDVFNHRPALGGSDWMRIVWRACWMRSGQNAP